MAAISRGHGCLTSNLRTRCLLRLAMPLPTFDGITKINLEISAKMLFQILKMATICRGQGRLRSTSWTRCHSTPSNVPTKFCWNNQNRIGEKCKNTISDPKNGRHFPRSLPLEMSLPTSVAITKIYWEKSAKM